MRCTRHARSRPAGQFHDVKICYCESCRTRHRPKISLEIFAPKDIVAANLPDHQMRPIRQHVAVEPGQRLVNGFAPDALIDHINGAGRAMLAQSQLKPGRIAAGRRTRTDTFGGRRSDGYDHDRRTLGQAGNGMQRSRAQLFQRRGRRATPLRFGMGGAGRGAAAGNQGQESRRHHEKRGDRQLWP